MNIFVTDKCPNQSAIYLDDKRKNKMCLESAQMLATAICTYGGQATYKPTHLNHPSNVWCRTTRENYRWLLRHFAAFCRDYTRRTGKTHGCAKYTREFIKGLQIMPQGGLTPFANCAANESKGVSFKHILDTPTAYKLYLEQRWKNDIIPPKWT